MLTADDQRVELTSIIQTTVGLQERGSNRNCMQRFPFFTTMQQRKLPPLAPQNGVFTMRIYMKTDK